MEIWKDVIGYKGNYEVSSLGRVRSVHRMVWNPGKECYRQQSSRILKLVSDRKGYLRVTLSLDGKIHQHLVHKLVAKAFIPNPDNLPQINHKDEITSNNEVSNLEWCTNEYNCNYGRHNDRLRATMSIEIEQLDLEGNLIKSWASSREAERVLGIPNNNIQRCCHGGFQSKGRGKWVNVTTAGGYKWRFKKNND